MIRSLAAASASLAVLGACVSTPVAAATGADQTISVQNGQIRCLISADFEGAGIPAAICGRTDGIPFQTSPADLNLSLIHI